MNTTMRALVLHGIGDLRQENVPVPRLRPGTVRVRVGFCGVCGSDIPRCFAKGTYRFPTICGHEFAGIIEAVAADVTTHKAGAAVAVFPLLWCGKCSACAAGKYAQCFDYDYLGSRSDGGFAQNVIVPVANLLAVPPSVPLDVAALTEPTAVALHALRRARRTVQGAAVVIFGAGPIGLLVAQWARVMGAQAIFLFDIVPTRLELARRMGFTLVFDSRQGDVQTIIAQHTNNQGAHIAVDAAGVSATLNAAIAATRRGGVVVILGNPAADVTITAPLISQAMRCEIDLAGAWNSDYRPDGHDDDWHLVMQAFANGSIDPRPLITHRVQLAQAAAALAMMQDRTAPFAKVLIQP